MTRLLYVPGENDSARWLLFAFLLSTSGVKCPCSIGWLTGEIFGDLSEDIATGAVQNAVDE